MYVFTVFREIFSSSPILDISVILPPHFGHIDPPCSIRSKNRFYDKFTVFFSDFLLLILNDVMCGLTDLK
ncbi:hypothetical protein L21SP5_00784 [Salinivirga cyanobacteriivorans]|uniref:Uncharacterized protein n=1 Tax=Salinivirga cyanobacteriivorans TaxID=1307839 RepID=A0A0S2HWJ4_9BACT|nr:hypothetical protein L21SP5_00784 [Salinivirga cyanobacteriivorans]